MTDIKRVVLDGVFEVKNVHVPQTVSNYLQEGWVLLGVFGDKSPIYSLGRVPEELIPHKNERKKISKI